MKRGASQCSPTATAITSADFDRTRRINIRVESLSPWQSTVEQSTWTYTVRPTNLARKVN